MIALDTNILITPATSLTLPQQIALDLVANTTDGVILCSRL